MSVVNFTVPQMLEDRIRKLIREKGFSSKAEFFRMAAIYLADTLENSSLSERRRTEQLVGSIEQVLEQKYSGKQLPSLEQQLSDV